MKNKLYIGCSGFSEHLWKGFFYPKDLPTKDYLQFYSKNLNALEINSTFYRRPTNKTLEKWHKTTPEDFKFFIKIPKNFTHIKRLQDTSIETEAFCEHIYSGLQEKLAGFLFQLPPSFKYSEENLSRIIETVDQKFLNVVEFRDRSWWNREVMDLLEKFSIIFSGVSIPKDIPSEVVINSEKNLYYRLHGIPTLFKSEYSEWELDALGKEIMKFPGTSFVFFNNTFGTAGIKNALYLSKVVKHFNQELS